MTIIIKLSLLAPQVQYILKTYICQRLKTPEQVALAVARQIDIINKNGGRCDGWTFDQNLPEDWKFLLTPNRKSGWADTKHGTLVWDFGLEEEDQFIALKGGE
tara:strand:+ start:911 stop:1219 length:309 start_codon:yes stop_codon:yes gene_type:complete